MFEVAGNIACMNTKHYQQVFMLSGVSPRKMPLILENIKTVIKVPDIGQNFCPLPLCPTGINLLKCYMALPSCSQMVMFSYEIMLLEILLK